VLKDLVFRLLKSERDHAPERAGIQILIIEVKMPHLHMPGLGADERIEVLEQGGFAGAGHADQSVGVSFLNLQGEMVERGAGLPCAAGIGM